MAVAGPSGPVMGREEVDRALARLGAEHEAIESSLLALQDHPGRRLLEGAELTGVTKERWAARPTRRSPLLWAHFEAYAGALARRPASCGPGAAGPPRPSWRELTELLRGDGVTVTGADVPDARPLADRPGPADGAAQPGRAAASG